MVGKIVFFIVLTGMLQATASVKTILFYGDSITAGYGLSPEEAFPALVEKELNKSGKPCKAINAGLSGETSAGGLSRIDWVLRQPVDVFVLELGGNDGLRGLPVSETKKNLQAIITKVKTKYPDAKIVLAGMEALPNMGNLYTTQFREVFSQLAKENKCVLIPFLLNGVGGIEKLNQDDGIHPNAEGHKVVANTILKSVKPLL
jgi:acyl-CoA thioesterase-1